MTADELLAVFDDAAEAARTALEPLTGAARRERTERPGQYALDLVADAAVLPILHEAGVAIVSEESGRSGRDDAAITVVLDPVDGSTNCSRDIPYWSISLCAVDADGPLCALVTNQATGVRTTAERARARGGTARSSHPRPYGGSRTRWSRSRGCPNSDCRGSSSGPWARPRSSSATWRRARSTPISRVGCAVGLPRRPSCLS